MNEDGDSRTAAFSLKRPYSDTSLPENNSSASTPRKRSRRAENLNTQDLKDFVPSGGSFSATAAMFDAGMNDTNEQATNAPSVSWNTGTKAKIRVSLRDRAGGDQPVMSQDSASLPRTSISNLDGGQDTEEITTEQERKAQTDLAVAEGRRLYIGNLAYAATEADLRSFFADYSVENIAIPVNPRTSRSVGYGFSTLSTRAEATRAVNELNGGSIADRQISVQPSRPGNGNQNTALTSQKSFGKSESKEALSLDIGEESSSNPRPDHTVISLGSEPVINTLGNGANNHVHRARHQSPSPRSSISIRSADVSEDDQGVIIHLDDQSGHESGEISDSRGPEMDTDQEEKPAFSLDGACTDDDSDPEDTDGSLSNSDAMMDYADSKAPLTDTGVRNPSSAHCPQEVQPKTLAQLSQKDLELQLRYFHVTKVPQAVDVNGPVRCLICTREGHMAIECEKMNCMRCGQPNAHSRWNCPTTFQASRPPYNIACELCERQGHPSADCELVWRTSGRPWESNLEDKRIRFECYECGRSGHLGNDCPSRRPKKNKGSSSWTYHRHPRPTEKAVQGISIKGRAQQQREREKQPIFIDDGEDDEANFRRSKVSAPARPGDIKIMAGNGPKLGGNGSRNQMAFTHNHYGDAHFGGGRRSASPSNMDYYEPARFAPVNADAAYRRDAHAYQQPPLPREPPPYRARSPPLRGQARRVNAAETYRPMPSSAQSAWRQFRM